MKTESATDMESIATEHNMNTVEQPTPLTQEALLVEDEARLINRQHGERINMYRTQIALAASMGLNEQVEQLREELKKYVELKGELTEKQLNQAKLDILSSIPFARSIQGTVNNDELADKFNAILEDRQREDTSKEINLSALEALGGSFGAKLEILLIPRKGGWGPSQLHVIRLPETINSTNEDIYITNSSVGVIDRKLRVFKMSKKFQLDNDIRIKEADVNSIYDKAPLESVEPESKAIN